MNTKTISALLVALVGSTATVGASFTLHAPKLTAGGEIVGMVKSASGGKQQYAVVSLTSVSGSYSAPSSVVVMDQHDKDFVPHVLAVMKGTTVRFSNSDTFLHNVFSSSRVQTFNVSQAKQGDHTDLRFNSPGIVPIKCHIHANMKAYIVVLANPFFAVTSASGLFTINGVPAGTYALKVWSEGGSATQSITVPNSGPVKVIIQLKRP